MKPLIRPAGERKIDKLYDRDSPLEDPHAGLRNEAHGIPGVYELCETPVRIAGRMGDGRRWHTARRGAP